MIKSIYYKKTYWKFALLLAAFLIGGVSIFYTNTIVRNIANEERSKMRMFASALKELSNPPEGQVLNPTFVLDYVRSVQNIPVILTDEYGNILDKKNIDKKHENDTVYLKHMMTIMREQHNPIRVAGFGGFSNYIYYRDSDLLYQLRYYPYFQIGVIGLFLIISYIAFNMARSYEQDFVWVGMAKETAHQLGTPISALKAWVEYLSLLDRAEDAELLPEMSRDLNRLEMIADRFSKIGSTPKLEPADLSEVLANGLAYMRSRVPEKVEVNFEDEAGNLRVALNAPLFEWVIENLSRNAVDAMEGSGQILVRLSRKGNFACIDFSDTGKGIPASMIKNIFKPGITTKQRGWGLGLTLAKRIIDKYHRGKITVKESKPGKGTTFRILIPEYKWD